MNYINHLNHKIMKTLILIISLIFCAGLNSFSQKKVPLIEIGTSLSEHLFYPEIILGVSWNNFEISGFYKRTVNLAQAPEVRYNGAGIRGQVYLNRFSADVKPFVGIGVMHNAWFERYFSVENEAMSYKLSNGYGLFAGLKCSVRDTRINLIFKIDETYYPDIGCISLFGTSVGFSYRITK